jgi:hydroxyethylthiazole kinase-like uncharacterized protein yjeF
MRQAHTVAQVRDAEQVLLDALPEGALMARAATGLAHAVIDFLGGAVGRRVVLLVGSGDNGGDALFAGARLARRGAVVEAVLLGSSVHEAGLAALTSAGGRVTDRARRPDVVVDGIVGIGGRPGLRPDAVDALEAYAGVPVVAVDVPSGVDVDTGRLEGPHVRADLTVTFGTHKVCHLVDPAAEACGTVHLVDIGLDLPEAAVASLQPEAVARMLRRPGATDHKYTRGVVGVRAGSGRYPGAGLLCVAGAASGLAGMVRYRPVDDDPETARRVLAARPEVVVSTGSTTGGGRVQAWVVGSGGGEKAAEALAEALADEVPVVVDADALAAVTGPAEGRLVLTPHAGELARMLDLPREEVEGDQLRCARLAAERFAAVTVLKTRHTLVAHPDGRVRVTTTGNPWLATAGAGDVLAGVVGALLATGLDPFDAAAAGSWLHGAAATLAARGGGPADGSPLGPIVAGDVADALPDAVRRLFR